MVHDYCRVLVEVPLLQELVQAIAGVGPASKGRQGHVRVHGVGDRTDGAGILGFHHCVAMVPFVMPPMG